MATFNTIIVPTDFSENSVAALETAVALARDLGSRVRLVHVGHDNPLQLSIREGLLEANDDRETIAAKARAWADRHFEALLAPLGDAATIVECILLFGNPANAIVEHMRADGGELVIMGRHGMMPADVILGSVAARVVRYAPCPVMLV